jgi:hypothetical protein
LRLHLFFLAVIAALREIVAVGTVTSSVAVPFCTGTKTIVIAPPEPTRTLCTR